MAVGVLFAPLFLWRGVPRVDEAARSGTWGFRLMIAPGVVMLWPWAARIWARGNTGPPPLARPEIHRRRHLALWTLTGPVALAGLALAVVARSPSPAAPTGAPDAAALPGQQSAPLKGGPR